MPVRLTDRAIAALPLPASGSVFHYDSEVNGLCLRVRASGLRSFCFDWREGGLRSRKKIGNAPAWTIGKARIAAAGIASPR